MTPSPPEPTVSPGPTRTTGGGPSPTGSDALARFRERCLQETRALDEAEIRFDKVVRLDDGERTRFEVILVQPGVLPSASVPLAQGRVQLACTVEARLTSPGGGIEIRPDEWVSDQYLPPDPTSWTWLVTGTDPGEADALLQLRPAVLVGAGANAPAPAALGTVDFTVTFDVERTITDTAGKAWTWIVGLVGFVAVALGIPITYRALRGTGTPTPTTGTEGRPGASFVSRMSHPSSTRRSAKAPKAPKTPKPQKAPRTTPTPQAPQRNNRPSGGEESPPRPGP
ncbi:hypothetical protein LL946_14120 [Knoellia locipacati]|uniref:hypothetical protein n=1 Tax=Knoellia locipacati TaxID=882824 RepID=UPI00384AB772